MAATTYQHSFQCCLVRGRALNRRHVCFSSASAAPKADEVEEWLVKLKGAHLGYPGVASKKTQPMNLTVRPARFGGHAILGTNGSGKSLLANAVAHFQTENHHHVISGELQHSPGTSVASVSFESHEALLAMGGSTYSALTPFGGLLSKAAQFLVVRFGLYPLLTRDVHTLSTGEIRKVLLVRALSTRPRLLILDNAFDGLDVPSRQSLADLVSKTLKGFRPDILVQGVDAKATAHTQVLLATHRPEEIVDEVSTVTILGGEHSATTVDRKGRTGSELFQYALGHDHWTEDPWDNVSLPSEDDIKGMWRHGRQRHRSENVNGSVLVKATNVRVSRGGKDLLSGLDWSVRQGERWLVAGANGSGKSTLSRFLAKPEARMGMNEGHLEVALDVSDSVGWVSTERHLSFATSQQTAREILLGADPSLRTVAVDIAVGNVVAAWLELAEHQLSQPFCKLSQGEQKLVLIASAVAKAPTLLIIDEPLQGLDAFNRRRVLGLVERICRYTDTSLIYVTHHFEELIPSITHVLHLAEGKSVYTGDLDSYDPDTTI